MVFFIAEKPVAVALICAKDLKLFLFQLPWTHWFLAKYIRHEN